jgi:hypothetical protein
MKQRFSVLGSAVLGSGSGCVVLWFMCAVLAAQAPRALLDRAVGEFEQGRFAASASTFDELAKVISDEAPQLWQRGIALYYAGRYGDCRRQFESHRTVNPDDVENAAWHFLCVAREDRRRRVESRRRATLRPVLRASLHRFVFRSARPERPRVETHQRSRLGSVRTIRRLHAHGGGRAPEI